MKLRVLLFCTVVCTACQNDVQPVYEDEVNISPLSDKQEKNSTI